MKRVALHEICALKKGRKPNVLSNDQLEGWKPYILIQSFDGSRTSFSNDTKCTECMEDDTLIVSDGARSGLASFGHAGYIGSTIAALVPNKEKVSPRYLYYFVQSQFDLLNTRTKGATIPHLDKDYLMAMTLYLPALLEQEQIVRLLDEAESLQDTRERANVRMEKFVPALFQEMFGDFKEMTTLGNLVEEFRYGTSNKSNSNGYPTLRIPNVIGQKVDLDDLKYVPVNDEEFKRIQMNEGDILFVRSNGNPDNIGRSAVFESNLISEAGYEPENFIYASYLIRARLKKETVDPHYLQMYLSTNDGRKEVKKRARTSAGQYNINTENLSTIPVLLPPLALQREFAARVGEARGVQSAQGKSSEKIEALYQSMLSRAFAGEL